MPIVLDEVQNLSHRPEAPIGKILREGRKFGLAGIFATQTMSNLRADEQDQLFQAAHKLFFAPAESEVREYAKLLHDVTGESVEDWRQRLLKLSKGECWSLGPVVEPSGVVRVKPLRVRITPFPERGFGNAG
jgi:DNA phosphorothioation-dependent restriction protein DptH